MIKFLSHPLVLILFTLLCITFFFSLRENQKSNQQVEENVKNLERIIKEKELNINQTKEKLEEANSPLSQEKIIRNDLMMKKEGEYVVQIPNEMIQVEEEQSVEAEKSIWDEWNDLLFNF